MSFDRFPRFLNIFSYQSTDHEDSGELDVAKLHMKARGDCKIILESDKHSTKDVAISGGSGGSGEGDNPSIHFILRARTKN